MKSVAILCLVVLCVAVPQQALAGNDSSYFMGTTAAMTGGTAVASDGDPAAVWYNPAGLATIDRNKVDLMMTVFSWQRRPIESGLAVKYADIERTVDLDGSQVHVASPSSVIVHRFSELTVGAGLFVTGDEHVRTAGETSWFGSGEAQRLDAQVTLQRNRYHGGVALGAQVAQGLRLGCALFGVYESGDRDYDFAIGWTAPGLTFTRQLYGHDVSDRYGVQVSAGAQLALSKFLTLGVTLRSPTVLLYEGGESRRFSTTAATGANVQAPTHRLAAEGNVRDRAQVGLWEPARVTAGIGLNFSGVALNAEAEFAHALRSLPVNLQTEATTTSVDLVQLNPLFNARAGALISLFDSVQLGFGLFTDHSADAVAPELAQFAVDYYGATAGIQYETEVQLGAEERVGQMVFRTGLSARYAYGSGSSAQLAVDLRDPAQATQSQLPVDVRFHEFHLVWGTSAHF